MEDQTTRKSRVSFSLRSLLEVVAIFSLILALLYGKTDWLASCNGRYQIHLVGEGDSAYLLDTKTAKLWESNGTQGGRTLWIDSEPDGL